jgi:hypothetical protein
VKAWLIAKYKQCIDDLMRRQVKEALSRGEVEETITYLSSQPEFRYRIMAYGIMNHNLEYDRSRGYLDTLQTSKTEEDEFISVQQIYLDYITDIDNYVLNPTDSASLRIVAQGQNPLAGYARSVFCLLTGERIPVNLPHLDGTVTPRSNESATENQHYSFYPKRISVFPNPTDQSSVEISINHFVAEGNYEASVYDIFGRMIAAQTIFGVTESIHIGNQPGVYFIRIAENGRVLGSTRVIKQ